MRKSSITERFPNLEPIPQHIECSEEVEHYYTLAEKNDLFIREFDLTGDNTDFIVGIGRKETLEELGLEAEDLTLTDCVAITKPGRGPSREAALAQAFSSVVLR